MMPMMPTKCWYCGWDTMRIKTFEAGRDAAGYHSRERVGGKCRVCGATWVARLPLVDPVELPRGTATNWDDLEAETGNSWHETSGSDMYRGY